MSKTETVSIGNCGEYFVAAELERNGFTVALPMSNTRNFDILAINKTNNKQIALQIKTNHTNKRTWTLCKKNENLVDENIYYVFVCLNYDQHPDYYILPGYLVAESIKKSHANWLFDKKGNDTAIRKFSFEYSKYNPYNLDASQYKSAWGSIGNKYYELTRFLPILHGDYFGEWNTDKIPGGTLRNIFHFPCVSYTNEIEDFSASVQAFIENHPELKLQEYKRILKENNIEIDTIKKVDFSGCNAQCVCAMIVANVLAEKFCEGAILDSCKDKTFLKLLERLENLG